MFFGQMWKLHSLEDYMFVILIFAAGLIAITLYTRHLNSKRNDAYAQKLVHRKLKPLIRDGRIYSDVSFQIPDDGPAAKYIMADHLIIDKKGILLIKTFGFGLWIKGSTEAPQWQLCDHKKQVNVSNPLLQFKYAAVHIKEILKTVGLDGIPITTLVILADVFERPDLPSWSNDVIRIQDLKSWYKNRVKSESSPSYISLDYARLAELIITK